MKKDFLSFIFGKNAYILLQNLQKISGDDTMSEEESWEKDWEEEEEHEEEEW